MNHVAHSSRSLLRVDTTSPAAPGFVGQGHSAVEVVYSTALASSDPFVLLMDDRLEIPELRQIGGAHPHAGLETVTFILEGSLDDRDEGKLEAGDVVWMSAGRGIIHNEAVEMKGRTRVLQLWIALPAEGRKLDPRFEIVRRGDAPQLHGMGVSGRLYSGSSGLLRSNTRNRVPTTMVDLELAPHIEYVQNMPSTYRGFVYVLRGEVSIGTDIVQTGQVGWFDPAKAEQLDLRAETNGVRLVLYAGLPTCEPLIQQGPFVAGSPDEIKEFHQNWRRGLFTPMSRLPAENSVA